MKILFHYFLTMFVLAILLVSQAFITHDVDHSRAIIIEEVSESRSVAEDSNGDVDEILASHSILFTNIYLSTVIIFVHRSDFSDIALPIWARAPPIA